jgi:hypothetical protein
MWFHKHRWRYINVINYIDISYGGKADSHKGTKQCIVCGKFDTYIHYQGGFVKLEDLNRFIDSKPTPTAKG